MSNNDKTFIIQPIVTLGADSYLSGTTLDGSMLYYNMADNLSAFTTDFSSIISNSHISNVELSGSTLIFTGLGNAFSGDIDLNTLSGNTVTNNNQLINGAGYITGFTIPSTYIESGDNISELNNDVGYITGYTDTNDYVTSQSFNTTNGTLTSTRLSGGTFNVNLDGRYSLTTHTHNISDINNFPTSVSYFSNDSGYITGFTIPSTYLESGDNVSELVNDSGYSTQTLIAGTNISIVGSTISATDTNTTYSTITDVDLSNTVSTTGGLITGQRINTWANNRGLTTDNISNWDTSFGWGDHSTANYQSLLISGTNIKTINGTSILGSGDIAISGGGSYSDEEAQDAIGTILTDSSEIDFTYNDATPSITAIIKTASIDVLKLDSGVQTSLGKANSALQTETDPTVPAYSKSLTAFSVIKTSSDALYEPKFTKLTGFNKDFGTTSGTVAQGNDSRINNGQTAFGWGNHASVGYLTSIPLSYLESGDNVSELLNDVGYLTGYTETDPIWLADKPSYLTSAIATSTYEPLLGFTPYNVTNPAGYITASSTNTLTNKSGNISQWTNDIGYITSYTDTNTTYTSSNGILLTGTNFAPTYGTAINTIAQGNDSRINNGQTAFGWGNHSTQGYLTTYIDTNDYVTSQSFNTTNGTLTSTRLSGGTFNVNLDGRYSLTTHTHTFSSLTSKPTTISGYGITDFNSLGDVRWSSINHVHDISEITGFVNNSTNWNLAYNDSITGVTVTGGVTKTLTLQQRDGTTLTTDFTDNSGSSDIVTGMTFNTGNGNLTLETVSGSTITESLDGRYLTSFTETDPTVPTYAKSLTAFSVIKTSTDTLYELKFNKNTAFNKNYGTTSDTIAQGNHTHTFSSLTSKPTTISGYGITDFNSLGDARWSLISHTHTFASITSKPTTLAGFGITDSYTKTESDGRYSQTDTTYNVFSTGVAGLVPARVGAVATKYLREDGSWVTPIDTNTTYTSSNGILLSGTNFTPTYGTSVNTIAQGNDSRIVNGQTAFGWGNHASAGYSTQTLTAGTNISISGNTISSTDTNTTYTSNNGILLSGTNFAPTYGTAVNTIVQGNDSRVNNGQTAFGWGNHASAGYQANLVSGTSIKTINGTSILGSGDIVISGGGTGGAFIPLSGTEAGSPVTGSIEFDGYVGSALLFPSPTDPNVINSLFNQDGFLDFQCYNSFTQYVKYFRIGDDSTTHFVLDGDDPLFRGLEGMNYYGANYDDNTYVQKKYVDDEITAITAPREEDVIGSALINLTASGTVPALDFNTKVHGYYNLTGAMDLPIILPTLAIGETVTRTIEIKANGFATTLPTDLIDNMSGEYKTDKRNFIAITYCRIDAGTIVQFSNISTK